MSITIICIYKNIHVAHPEGIKNSENTQHIL